MGCWHQTCALTNLPINPNEKVRCYLIFENPIKDDRMGSGGCYPFDFYSHVYLPLKGEYNDYGGIENIEEDAYSKLIYKFLTNPKQVKYVEDDEPITLEDNISLEDLINKHVERGNAYIIDNVQDHDCNLKIYLMMVHETLFLQATKYLGNNSKEVIERACHRDLFPRPVDEEFKPAISLASSMHMQFSDYSSYDDGLEDIFSDKTVSVKDKRAAHQALKDHFLFINFLYHTRKPMAPQVGQGSQNNSFKPYKYLIKAVQKYMVKRNAYEKKVRGE